MICPSCNKSGYVRPKMGRPIEVDDAKIRRLFGGGYNQCQISRMLGISRGAVQASLKRTKGKR
jgi:hypothetical protein